ncbi:uncharacterized protein BO80DRAFT_426008 [Aspergillus ibericus CBS 121593]|uniref:Uncharacterized protein n=1 Tax=Aspergillus ibericus CBS 121593 TaxID=1448316 RepID=A0A395GXY1_9EURO|nr:hypothetical protein BO80DRAFT_426008 [Aspergillus ibericus CBS 121593]RAK99918.1 hypothetical protein BO80DRAFT_426008 [Aspergillus ibericus CBS 121593]
MSKAPSQLPSRSNNLKMTLSRWRSRIWGYSAAQSSSASDKLNISDKKNTQSPVTSQNESSLSEADGNRTVTRDLWAEAFEELSPQTQTQLSKFGYLPDESSLQKRDIDTLLHGFQQKSEKCEQKSWKYKTERHEIIVRDYAAKCATWVQKVGDLILPFAPSPVAGPWGLVKALLQIPVSYAEEMLALLGTLEKALQIIHHGSVYESVYTAETVPEFLLAMLQRDLIKVYKAVLELLNHCTVQLSKPMLKRLVSEVLYPDRTSGMSSNLSNCQVDLTKTIQTCESQRSADANGTATKLLHAIHRPLLRIEAHVTNHLTRVDKNKALELLEWISPVPYGKHHTTVQTERAANTGEWLLQHPMFRDWEENSSSAVLWLRGSPGVGKTFLTSKVIDHIQEALSNTPNHEGLAFFYCNRNDVGTSQPLSVAQSYIRQLSTTARGEWEYFQVSLEKTCVELRSKGAHLDLGTCKKLLTNSLSLYPRTTLVLDALDECDPVSREKLILLFKEVLRTSTRPIKLFISGRPDGDIRHHFSSQPTIEIQSSDNHKDIETYVCQMLPRLAEKNSEMRDLQPVITSRILGSCQGMFQWTFLQLEQLRDCVSREAILECLGTLPRTLDEAYDNIYSKIVNGRPHDRDLANRAFMWVMAAARPLHRVELLQAIRIDPDQTTLNMCAAITEDSLQTLCRNLLVLDSQGLWRISHLSVAEYFESRHGWTPPVTSLMASKVCLLLLLDAPNLLTIEESGLTIDDEANTTPTKPSTYDPDNFFQEYLPCYWPTHIQIAEQISLTALAPVTALLERFLGTPYESSSQYRVWCDEVQRFHRVLGKLFYPGTRMPWEDSILTACEFGFNLSLKRWWEAAAVDHTRTNVFGQTPLTIAVSNGHVALCRTLLQKGADPHAPQGNANLPKLTPLVSAVTNGSLEGVRFLVREAHVDVDTQLANPDLPCALDAAICQKNSEIMHFLVTEARANVDMELTHGKYGSCLAHAAAELPLETVKYLVEEGRANVNLVLRHGIYGSALVAAVALDPLAIFKARTPEQKHLTMKYLVEKGKANVNLALQTGTYGSALAAAAMNEDDKFVNYLVDVGNAEVNMPLPSSPHGSALSAAAYYGNKAVVEVLIAAGASIMLALDDGRTANAVAAARTSLSEEDHKQRFLIIFGHISEFMASGKAEIAGILKHEERMAGCNGST